MIIIIFILIIIITLYLLYNKDTFVGNELNNLLNIHLNEIKIFDKLSKNTEQKLKYNPMNDIIDKYSNKVSNFIKNKKEKINTKYNKYNDKLNVLEEKYQNLKKQIHPSFKHSNIFRLNKYETDRDDKIKYLTLKKINIDNDNDFQVLLNNGKCLTMMPHNRYKIDKCDNNNKYQYFNLDFIYDNDDFVKIVKPDNRYPLDINTLKYPIVLVRSANNKNCINLNDDKLSIEQCKYKDSHLWKLSD